MYWQKENKQLFAHLVLRSRCAAECSNGRDAYGPRYHRSYHLGQRSGTRDNRHDEEKNRGDKEDRVLAGQVGSVLASKYAAPYEVVS